MGRLYWKIFLGFWFTTVAIVVVTSWSVSLVTGDPEERNDRDRRHRGRHDTYLATAKLLVESGGKDALVAWLKITGGGRHTIWAIDASGRDVLDRPVPAAIGEVLLGRAPAESSGLSLGPVSGPDGAAFRLWLSRAPRSLFPPRPVHFAVRLGVAVLVSGLVCWWLASYLTRPLRHLQLATRRLASGDLGARVGPVIGPRRDEIAALGADFDRMAGRLERLLAAQRQLLRDVSHELRSPLARLQVAAGLARRRGTGVDAEMDRIDLEIQRLEQLISQLLSLMRLEAGADPPARTVVDLAVLLNGVARDAAFEADSCRRRVVVTKAIPCTVVGDPALLRSALENLVRNGVRHSDENTVVELSLDRDPNDRDGVLVQVRDHGGGVPPGDLSRLFDPFFRVEAARDRGSGGYGLGLTIADRAVRLHGGNMAARNAEGGGLLVEVRLPARINGTRAGATERALIAENRG